MFDSRPRRAAGLPAVQRGQTAPAPSAARSALYAIVALIAVLLVGCARYGGRGLEPGTTADEVRSVMGKPQRIWEDPNGGASWEYARGPAGQETFMVRLDASGRLFRIDQVLQDEFFAKIREGMSQEDVERTLGRPYRKDRFKVKKEDVWTWRYLELNFRNMCFYAHFEIDGALLYASKGEENVPPFGGC